MIDKEKVQIARDVFVETLQKNANTRVSNKVKAVTGDLTNNGMTNGEIVSILLQALAIIVDIDKMPDDEKLHTASGIAEAFVVLMRSRIEGHGKR